MALVSAYGLLSWVQYEYYGRVLELRTEGIRNQMKEAMGEVAEELQVRELIRYLNKGLSRKKDRFEDSEFQPTSVASFDIWTRTKLDTQIVQRALDRENIYLKMPHKGNTSRVDYRPSDRLVHAYFSNLHELDRYILKYLYDSYNKDSIPQMVNVRLLKSLIREHLDNKDLCGPYMMSLHDYQGRTLYEYIPPAMVNAKRWEERNTVVQYLFVPTDGAETDRPYMKVTLDVTPTKSEVLRLALPSFISTIIVLVLGFSALGVLLKHMSFSSQRTSFINNMTHELKTPVSTILLSSQSLGQSLAERGDLTPRAQSALDIIGLEAQRMKFLIDKVLQFSLLDGASGRFSLEPLDVNELLLPVAEIYTFHAQQRGGDLELDLDALIERSSSQPVVKAQPVSTYPAAKEDFAFVVDEATPSQAVAAAIIIAGGKLLDDVRLFDVYRGPQLGPGRKSLAFSVRLRASDHTLSASETEAARARIIKQVGKYTGAKLRA